MKKILITISMVFAAVLLMAAVGDTLISVMTDSSGNVVSTPLVFSNQVNMVPVATNGGQLIRYANYTNSSASIITSDKIAIVNGGTGTNVTQLTGTWTNTVNFQVNGTNNATQYRVGGVLGFSGSVTNTFGGSSPTVTNIMVYGGGVLTNVFRP